MDESKITRRTLLAAAAGAVGNTVLPLKQSSDSERLAGKGANVKVATPEVRSPSERFNVESYGAKGNGVTDDTAAIQAAIDAGRGKTVVIPEGTFIHAGVFLSGSTYSGTTIVCYGELRLRPRLGTEAT